MMSEPRALQAVIDSLRAGLLVIDVSGTIQFANRSASELFGYREDELHGCPLNAVLHTAMEWPPRLGHSDREIECKQRDGSTVTLKLSIMPVDCSGRRMYAGMVSESSSLCGPELNRHQLHRDRAPHDETRIAFLRRVSHELRTPLTSILGYAELLELDAQDSELRDGLEIIRKNGEEMLAALTSLMDDFAYWMTQDSLASTAE